MESLFRSQMLLFFSNPNCDCLFGKRARYYLHYFRYYPLTCIFPITCITFNKLSAVAKSFIKRILLLLISIV